MGGCIGAIIRGVSVFRSSRLQLLGTLHIFGKGTAFVVPFLIPIHSIKFSFILKGVIFC